MDKFKVKQFLPVYGIIIGLNIGFLFGILFGKTELLGIYLAIGSALGLIFGATLYLLYKKNK